MKVILSGRQSQCVMCERVFKSDSACEKHKSYATPKTDGCKDPSSLGMVEGSRGWSVPVPEEAKWWGEPVERVPAGPQVLVCKGCGKEWERAAQRGRKPSLCPECKCKCKSEVTPSGV